MEPKIQKRKLGKSGLAVSALGPGCMGMFRFSRLVATSEHSGNKNSK